MRDCGVRREGQDARQDYSVLSCQVVTEPEHMETFKWDQSNLEEYISNQVEESLRLDYKAADALDKTDPKRMEITKDVSAMANSDGGLIIYGIKEFPSPKNHLPEKLDPIDRTKFSKEWLEHVIANIQPRITGLIVHPIPISSSDNHVAYVVEIPRSTTAHQATDKKYYMRYNFESRAMDDYQVRLVMNRMNYSDVSIRFGVRLGAIGNPDEENVHYRKLRAIIKNEGDRVVTHYRVELELHNVGWCDDSGAPNDLELIDLGSTTPDTLSETVYANIDNSVSLKFVYHPKTILFPQEEFDIGSLIGYGYPDEETWSTGQWHDFAEKRKWVITWKLYADNMPYKHGEESAGNLPILRA